MIKISLTVLVSLLMTQFAVAQQSWNSAAWNHTSSWKIAFPDTHAFTLWSFCQEPDQDLDQFSSSSTKVTLSGFHSQYAFHAPVYYSHQPGRDFVVIIPGLFGNVGEKLPRWLASQLLPKKNVIILPNPLGTDYMGLRPKHDMGDIVSEANSYYSALKEIKRKLSVNKLEILGVSHGAFIVAALNGIDHQRQQILSTATSISPPFNMIDSIRNLDSILNEGDMQTRPFLSFASEMALICNLHKFSNPLDRIPDEAPTMVAQLGFHNELINVIIQHLTYQDELPWYLEGGTINPIYKVWLKQQRFESTLEEYFPHGHSVVSSRYGKIDHWLNLAKRRKTRVLTCNDDFINDPNVWSQQGIVLNRCGHYGLRATPWFKKFLKLVF